MKIIQITPQRLLENKYKADIFLENLIQPTITENSWMTKWKDIAARFQLYKFLELSSDEMLSQSWDEEKIAQIIEDTIKIVERHIELDDELQITIVPTLSYPWFSNIDQSIWTNGYTDSSKSVWIAIPPNPDKSFLQYLLAHELHHSSPRNPIYKLTHEQFPLKDWYKMEGTAEFFALQFFGDKRWWKESFTLEIEARYIEKAKIYIHTNDFAIKGPLCFGSEKEQIPSMAGYAFAYNAVKNYVKKYPLKDLSQLFEINSEELIVSYSL